MFLLRLVTFPRDGAANTHPESENTIAIVSAVVLIVFFINMVIFTASVFVCFPVGVITVYSAYVAELCRKCGDFVEICVRGKGKLTNVVIVYCTAYNKKSGFRRASAYFAVLLSFFDQFVKRVDNRLDPFVRRGL